MTGPWPVLPLAELADQSPGKPPKVTNRGTPRPCLDHMNVRWFHFDLTDVREMRFEDDESDEFTARKGDLIVCKRGHPGRAAIWSHDEPVYLRDSLHRLRFEEPKRAKWFLYRLLLADTDGYLRDRLTSESGIPHLTGRVLNRFPVPVPPLPEQQRIVSILDKAFAGIATATASAEKTLADASRLFEGHCRSVFSRHAGDWDEMDFGSIGESLDHRRRPISKSQRVRGDVPHYGASGIVDYITRYLFDEDVLIISEYGENLLTRTRPIAFSATGKIWVDSHAHVVRFNDFATQKFVEFYLNAISLVPYVNTEAKPTMHQRSLNKIRVPLPPIDQRREIVANLERFRASTEQLQTLCREKLARLANLKRSLLSKAFGGELDSAAKDAAHTAAGWSKVKRASSVR
jgi:type I restriction enzyme S subunit